MLSRLTLRSPRSTLPMYVRCTFASSGSASWLRELLLSHPHSGDPDALFWPGRAHGPATPDWSRPVDGSSFLRHYFKPALARLGMEPMRVHDLRHTFASPMLAADFKPYEVSRWMGHANVATTDAIYAHLYPSDHHVQIAKFEAFVTEG